MIDEELRNCFQGAIPSGLATIDEDGNPNLSFISQVFYVDDTHVALSNQFFNKSMRNIHATKKGTVNVVNPTNFKTYFIELSHVKSETEGDLFDDMSMQLEAIASMCGMEDVFKLQAAEIFKVNSVTQAIMN